MDFRKPAGKQYLVPFVISLARWNSLTQAMLVIVANTIPETWRYQVDLCFPSIPDPKF